MHTPNPASDSITAPAQSLLLVVVPVLVLALSGCALKSDVEESGEFFKKIFRKETYTLYRPDVQQGNVINPDKIARLQIGMDKKQVRYLLGNPVTENVFHKDRWHYAYYLIPGEGERRRYRLILFFSDDQLYKIRKSRGIKELTEESRDESTRAAGS